MALMGLKREARRMGFKNKSAGPWDEGKAEKEHGVGKCGHWDSQLDDMGYCRDEDCRRERLIKALHNGEAMMTSTGVLLWTPGQKLKDV